jgi:hypothetical protein
MDGNIGELSLGHIDTRRVALELLLLLCRKGLTWDLG